MLKEIEIPIIEPSKDGKHYYLKYKNGRREKKDNINPFMNLEEIYNKQKATRKEKSMFITLESGESFEGQFVKVEEATGQFGEINRYTFLVNGEEKTLNSKSFKLLQNMIEAGIKEGDKVKITKEGTGFNTTYTTVKI